MTTLKEKIKKELLECGNEDDEMTHILLDNIMSEIAAYTKRVIGSDDEIDNIKLIYNDFEEQMKANFNMLRHTERTRAKEEGVIV